MKRKAQLLRCTGLLILCLFPLFGFISCSSVNTVYVCADGSQQSSPCATPNPTTNPTSPPSGTTQPPASTPLPGGGSTSPIDEGDFAINHRAATGPAIVEWWNGQGGANKACGTFQLPSGQTFDYHPAGHWWRYKSDQDMQAEWQLHLALYQQKSENAGCSIGQRPS